MVLDQILIRAGIGLLLVGVVLAIFLLSRRKHTQEMQRIYSGGATTIDVMDTIQKTSQASSSSAAVTQTTLDMSPETRGLTQESTLKLVNDRRRAPREQWSSRELDLSVLDGKYEIVEEITGGGMGRVFLGRSVKLGNEWIIKFIPSKIAYLANEAEVMKRLNNISLPQIVDIFDTDQGLILVESRIPGCSLQDALLLRQDISESMVCDWALQITRVLSYLHHLEQPIIHCDMKPSNIMVTHNNKLVLIDFGVSKVQGEDGQPTALTKQYAAPEQFAGYTRYNDITTERFGMTADQFVGWPIDVRTDIYSTGVVIYELLTGNRPVYGKEKEIYKTASREFADVVLKCIAVDPEDRYQTDAELEKALEDVQANWHTIPRKLLLRKLGVAACAACLAIGLVSTASGTYIGSVEDGAVINMEPSYVVLTAQQSVTVRVRKEGGFGNENLLRLGQLTWDSTGNDIAQMDEDRIIGLNPGEAVFTGAYRGKTVEVHVTVSEPMPEMTQVSLRYPEGCTVEVYAGNGERDHVDGDFRNASFVSPESMAYDDGKLLIGDSGMLCTGENGTLTGVFLDPFYLTVDLVRSYQGQAYVLTGPWEDAEMSRYGIARVDEEGRAKLLYETEAAWTVIPDMQFDESGKLWFVQQNLGEGTTRLNSLDVQTGEIELGMTLPDGAKSMAFGEDKLYISVPEQGIIIAVDTVEGTWEYFAGLDGERHFIDGTAPQFYMPNSIVYCDGALYVYDFDTVRKITIVDGTVAMTETLAGVPVADTNPEVVLGSGTMTQLPASELAELTVLGHGKILLSDPKNSVIYLIMEQPGSTEA